MSFTGVRSWVRAFALVVPALLSVPPSAIAQVVSGIVRDQTGAPLPGVIVEARRAALTEQSTSTDADGRFRLPVSPGVYEVSFALANFATVRRPVNVPPSGNPPGLEVVLRYVLSADVTVTGKQTFVNLADVENPAENLVGIAQSASQGAVTARQLEARPIMRSGEVLETVPGVVISQHSGEGKANQYYLRGFNLDHGTDFATSVAGAPVNMPTHGHGQGYSDLNFLIPEIVSGLQFSKGPYFAEQGDFATAGSATINYASVLDRSIVDVGGGGQGFGRALFAASPAVGRGHVLGALELEHNDGPWVQGDDYRKVNGVLRYSRADVANAFSFTAMGYTAKWRSTDQIPRRAVESGSLNRFGGVDDSGGGDTYRYSGVFEWQRTGTHGVTRVTAFGIGYNLNLFSDFTYFLDDPVNGDQFQQADHRFITGGRASYRRLGRLGGRDTQNTIGLQIRNDDIPAVGLYHTKARERLDTVREDSVVETSMAGYAQNETAWTPWLRSLAGLRVDGYRFDVDASDRANGGTKTAGLVSPKGGIVVGPIRGTELYVNAGLGFHSNDARGTTTTRDPVSGEPVSPVTPLARASGAEVGVRTVAARHLQSSLTLWSLSLDSELIFVGDAGTTEAGRPSHRWGFEFANYYSPKPWLIVDGDLSWSSASFTDADPAGDRIPGAVQTVVSAGVTLDSLRNIFGSARLRYFGPRPLVEDGSVSSAATSLVNLEGGYRMRKNVKVALDVFNLFNAADSDIDYYYASRLPGEPLSGIDDIHFHPALPRTARLSLVIAF